MIIDDLNNDTDELSLKEAVNFRCEEANLDSVNNTQVLIFLLRYNYWGYYVMDVHLI